jgi:hypothetical protein
MEIKNPKSEKEIYIYSAILKFTKKNGHVSENVRVIIRYKKGSKRRKEDLKIPKEINTFNLNWKKYMGGGIATYHREGDDPDHYYTSGGVTISTNLGQRLEDLVKEACFGNSDKIEHIK